METKKKKAVKPRKTATKKAATKRKATKKTTAKKATAKRKTTKAKKATTKKSLGATKHIPNKPVGGVKEARKPSKAQQSFIADLLNNGEATNSLLKTAKKARKKTATKRKAKALSGARKGEQKRYSLIYEDRKGNELMREQIWAKDIKEARATRDKKQGSSMQNDLHKIKVKALGTTKTKRKTAAKKATKRKTKALSGAKFQYKKFEGNDWLLMAKSDTQQGATQISGSLRTKYGKARVSKTKGGKWGVYCPQ